MSSRIRNANIIGNIIVSIHVHIYGGGERIPPEQQSTLVKI